MRLACVRVYVCVKEAASIHGAYNFVDFHALTIRPALLIVTEVLRGEGEIPAMFAWTSHSLLWRQSRQEPASVHAVHSRLFSKKPRARERGRSTGRLTPRSRSNRTLRSHGPFHTMARNKRLP